MFQYRNFEEVFNFNTEYSYDSSVIETIEANRKSLEGLFVDKIFKAIDIKRPAKFYPPKSNSDLRNLHSAICAGNGAEHFKLSILYYILLDCDAMTRGQTYSDAFEDASSLSRTYQILTKGLWHLDHLQFEIAIQYLTHPSLIPTFPEEVLEALVHHSKSDDFTLALAYYHTVHPSLRSPRAVESLFSAIARTSVTEAFYLSRAQSEAVRRRMFEMLISLILRSPASEKTASQGIELINLPLDQEEEQWFEDYLTKDEGRGLKKAKDTVMMRRIGTGRFSEALSLDFGGGKTSGGLNWEMLQDGLQEGLGTRVNV